MAGRKPQGQKGLILDTQALVAIGVVFLVGFGMGWLANGYGKLTSTGMVGSQPGLPHDHPPLSEAIPPELANRDFTSELASLQLRLGQNPGNASDLVQLGNVHFDHGALLKAQGREQERQQSYVSAVSAYERAIVAGEENADVLTDLGVSYRRAGNSVRAIEMFQRATELSPTHLNAWLNMGIVKKYDLNDLLGARDAWEMIVRHHPNSNAAKQIEKELASLPPRSAPMTPEELMQQR